VTESLAVQLDRLCRSDGIAGRREQVTRPTGVLVDISDHGSEGEVPGEETGIHEEKSVCGGIVAESLVELAAGEHSLDKWAGPAQGRLVLRGVGEIRDHRGGGGRHLPERLHDIVEQALLAHRQQEQRGLFSRQVGRPAIEQDRVDSHALLPAR